MESMQTRKVCPYFLRNKCSYGNSCRNEHTDLCEDIQYCSGHAPMLQTATDSAQKMCRRVMDTGMCKYEDRCYFSHQTNLPHPRQSYEQRYGGYHRYQQGYRHTMDGMTRCNRKWTGESTTKQVREARGRIWEQYKI